MVLRPKAVAFDIIDTVFRLGALVPALEANGMRAEDVDTLYAAMLRDAMALASAGGYAPLPDILGGALDQLRANRGMGPSETGRQAVADAMKRLDPHRDAKECFRRLRQAGIAVHALSNGAKSATEKLIDRAGFADFFDGVHSVEGPRKYKPHRAVYLAALGEMGCLPEEAMLVATHAWDCHGAKRVGMTAGFVKRGQPWPPAFDRPDVMGEELVDVANAILAMG
ncbi:haloacid dehalogenase type II [Aureimonas psammosilenae]|uniref:haloacid dehalogenase type II n=1 Tax=Aureimonas psammosilenae TaxID=2495496 RepID=UPI00186AAFA6|nr:haloacid dehalogenase type II [Aureimonas psammosilenae]